MNDGGHVIQTGRTNTTNAKDLPGREETPRVAVVGLTVTAGSDAFGPRLEGAVSTGVCGVVLDRQAAPLTLQQARAAADGVARLGSSDLAVVLVVPDPVADQSVLAAVGYAAATAPTLAAALALAAQRTPVAMPSPSGAPGPDPEAEAPNPLTDPTLAALATFGLRFRAGALLAARAAGLSVPEYLAVGALAVGEHTTPAELERFLALPADVVTDILGRLVDLGIATPTDARTGAVALTAVGRELLFAPAAELADDLRKVTSAIDPAARQALLDVLDTRSQAQKRHNERLRAWIAGTSGRGP